MVELIARTRLLIGDPAGAEQTFTDDEVQAALDRYQTVVRYAPLHPEPTPLPTGLVEYRDYYAGLGDWEADEQLYDAAWTALTPVTSDRLTGHWTFASPGQNPPLFILGKVYDVYGAAADLLEQWAAKVKQEFDFSTDGQSFQRSQKLRALLDLAREYRRRQRPSVAVQARADVGVW
ncbi:MAG: hypothetical protein IRY83_04080 [Chloroflexi bacterium]|nr:hypothetical protein [Chloroflexota bacterium]